ncbi:MAG: hypothetical protein ONB05_04255 [candidate division KSB1 bacterium]|nr:hypothetical protein [candidate division KSB1 bacterium]
MKSKKFKNAFNRFDPDESITGKNKIRLRWKLWRQIVEREDSPIEEMVLLLNTSKRADKILFVGQTGTGKATELAKLRSRLGTNFFIIHCALSTTITTQLNITDFFKKLLSDIFNSGLKRKVLKQEEAPALQKWVKKLEQEKEVRYSALPGSEAQHSSPEKPKKDDKEGISTTIIKQKEDLPPPDYVKTMGALLEKIRKKEKKKILIIVTGLDEIALDSAKELFTKSAWLLNALPCQVIFAFPSALVCHPVFNQIRQNFKRIYFLPHFEIEYFDGKLHEENLNRLKRIVRKRYRRRLFTKEALQALALNSGGLPRELITLVQECCLLALINNTPKIDPDIVRAAIERRQDYYQSILSSRQIELLRQVLATRDIEYNDEFSELVHNSSILEYSNYPERLWYNVHPLVLALLEPEETQPD